jgi:membrane-anchored glycerophosphoryl diester phosphodiesterase (GDPDase)
MNDKILIMDTLVLLFLVLLLILLNFTILIIIVYGLIKDLINRFFELFDARLRLLRQTVEEQE